VGPSGPPGIAISTPYRGSTARNGMPSHPGISGPGVAPPAGTGMAYGGATIAVPPAMQARDAPAGTAANRSASAAVPTGR
jgi:hypothetical protein